MFKYLLILPEESSCLNCMFEINYFQRGIRPVSVSCTLFHKISAQKYPPQKKTEKGPKKGPEATNNAYMLENNKQLAI